MNYMQIKVGKRDASLYAYLLDENISYNVKKKWPCVLIMPGGGYLFTSTKEGESIATKFFGAGYSCFILRYSTKVKDRITRELNEGFTFPDPSIELMEALHLIHEKAEEWHIDTDNLYINAYSAGAHATLTSILRGDESFLRDKLSFTPSADDFKIKGLILGYPMICAHLMDPIIKSAIFDREDVSEEEFKALDMTLYLKKDVCPMFIWQTSADTVVQPYHLAHFVGKALELGIPMEFHLFEKGPHGLGMADERYARSQEDISPAVAVWFDLALTWMKEQEGKD